MAALPYMQLYVAEYLADTMHLTAAQHGAYLLLLMNYWQRGKALPNNDDRLAAIVRMTPQEWKKNRDAVAEFFEVTEAEWVHKRVEVDLEAVYTKSTTNTKNGKLGGRPRKPNGSPEETEPKPNGLPNGSENETESKGIKNRTDKEQINTPFIPQEPITPEMLASGVITETRLSGKDLRIVLEEVCKSELPHWPTPDALLDAMVGAWREYETAKKEGKFTVYAKAPEKFFGGGDWRNKEAWPWKEGQQPKPKRIYVNGAA